MDPEILAAAEALLVMKDDKRIPLEVAAITLLELNKVRITEEDNAFLHKQFSSISPQQILKNSEKLIEYGILPPIQGVHQGGVKSPRISSPSPKKLAILDDIRKKQERRTSLLNKVKAKEQAKEYRDSIDELLQSNLEKGVLTQFRDTTYETLNPYLKGFDVCHPDAKIASKFTDALFPTKVVSYWKKTLSKSCRDIWEPTSPETQCKNTIGDVQGDTTCYICGFGFLDQEGLRPTCEHILPIIQAIFFLDLYRPSEKEQIMADATKLSVLRKEYAWAHQCCNYIKSDDSFLQTVFDEAKYPSWTFNTQTTGSMLHYIQNPEEGKFYGSQTIKQLILKHDREAPLGPPEDRNANKWINKRFAYIRDQKMTDIVNYIASKGNGGIVMMMGYGNCVDSSKINKDFKLLLSKFETKKPIFLSPKAKTMRNENAVRAHKNRMITARKLKV